MLSCCYQTCDVCHIYHEVCTNLVCNLAETLKVDLSCVCTCTCKDQFRLMLYSQTLYLVVIEEALIVYTIGYNVKVKAGKVHWASVRQMTAMVEAHAEYGVTWF